MKVPCVLLLALAAAARPAAAQQPVVRTLAAREVPAGLGVAGPVEAARRWTDRGGDNLLVLTRTPETPSVDAEGNPARSREIRAYHFVRRGSGYRLLWRTLDYVRDCDLDIVLDFAPGSLRVTDVDRDGVAETSYLYTLACRGGVDPPGMKLILHEGAAKYAVRGFQDYRELGGDYPAPEMRADAALASQPALRDFAVAQWRRFARPSAWRSEGPP
jgi:hypothetical protein